jgi:hypothetical protein
MAGGGNGSGPPPGGDGTAAGDGGVPPDATVVAGNPAIGDGPVVTGDAAVEVDSPDSATGADGTAAGDGGPLAGQAEEGQAEPT